MTGNERGECMRNISDIIEGYLKSIIEEDKSGTIEIKRNEIAEKFQCVPSQINYVINTRFTVERGYAVESKRGGGGYIRIFRVRTNSRKDLIEHVISSLNNGATHTMAIDIVYRLIEEEVISERESNLILAAVDRSTIRLPLPKRDEIRARILEAMLLTLIYEQRR
jgi:transcriptional regulator CtsR